MARHLKVFKVCVKGDGTEEEDEPVEVVEEGEEEEEDEGEDEPAEVGNAAEAGERREGLLVGAGRRGPMEPLPGWPDTPSVDPDDRPEMGR